jgi:hypothetical protein
MTAAGAACPAPVPFAALADYWGRALDQTASDAVEEHLFGCAACTERSAQVAALVRSLGRMIPPVITPARLAALAAGGARIRATPVEPGQRVAVEFARELDLLVHHLRGDLRGVRRVDCEVTADGRRLLDLVHVPFDAERGEVLIACQRHYTALGDPDTRFRITAFDDRGAAQVREYGVLHLAPA